MSNNEALDDKTVQALAERLGWQKPFAFFGGWRTHPAFTYDAETGEYGLSRAGVAACIEGLRGSVEYTDDRWHVDLWLGVVADDILPHGTGDALTAAVTAAVKEMFG